MPQKRQSRKYKNVGRRRPDLGNRYFRSKWEANIARWLEHLIRESAITSYEYEPTEFKFPIQRGPGSFYKPDFKVLMLSGEIEFWEVKGYLDATSKTRLKRMAKYFPEVSVKTITQPAYSEIEKIACRVIDGWE